MISFHLKWWMDTDRFGSRNSYLPSRSQRIPLCGCQSFRLGSSSGTDDSILSWSLVGRLIPAQYQHVRNNGHSFCTDKSLRIIPILCVEIWKILKWCLKQHIVARIRHIPSKFNDLADRLSRMDKIIKTE